MKFIFTSMTQVMKEAKGIFLQLFFSLSSAAAALVPSVPIWKEIDIGLIVGRLFVGELVRNLLLGSPSLPAIVTALLDSPTIVQLVETQTATLVFNLLLLHLHLGITTKALIIVLMKSQDSNQINIIDQQMQKEIITQGQIQIKIISKMPIDLITSEWVHTMAIIMKVIFLQIKTITWTILVHPRTTWTLITTVLRTRNWGTIKMVANNNTDKIWILGLLHIIIKSNKTKEMRLSSRWYIKGNPWM